MADVSCISSNSSISLMLTLGFPGPDSPDIWNFVLSVLVLPLSIFEFILPLKDLTEHGIDLWKNLAVLCNWICNHESTKHNTRIFSTADPELQEVFLPEDALLAGFSPLGLFNALVPRIKRKYSW